MKAPAVTVELAGVACTVVTREPALAELVVQRYSGFLSTSVPSFILEATVGPGTTHGHPLEISSGPVAMERRGHKVIISGDGFSATLDFASRRGTIVQPFNLTPLDLVLKVLYAHDLLEEKACFVHACAVQRDRGGHLFFGPTGSGKSTVAGLADGGVLADELVIVQRRDGAGPTGFMLHGTPFWNGRNASAKLAGLYALSRDHRTDSSVPIGPVQTLRRLLPCAGGFFPDTDRRGRLFDLTSSLAQAMTCEALSFSTPLAAKGWLNAHCH